jgi:hypothetical protein
MGKAAVFGILLCGEKVRKEVEKQFCKIKIVQNQLLNF